jgi:hypothetical protein
MKAIAFVKSQNPAFLSVGMVMAQRRGDPIRLSELMSKQVVPPSWLLDPLSPNDWGDSGVIAI